MYRAINEIVTEKIKIILLMTDLSITDFFLEV